MRIFLTIIGVIAFAKANFGQSNTIPTIGSPDQAQVLTLEAYLGFVKKFHPIAKQAALKLSEGQANVLKAKGGVDPKIEADYRRKDFKDLEYFDILDASFKIPTWYGVEFKAGFERNEGVFLNPEDDVPQDGLFAAGVTIDISQGLWINKRLTTLRKAKLYQQQTLTERDLLLNEVLYNAAVTYFDWLTAYQDFTIYEQFVTNAQLRYDGIQKSADLGEMAQIDAVEARITLQNRHLSLEQARIKLLKASLDLSVFLWLENNTPIEIQDNIIPNINVLNEIDSALQIDGATLDNFTIENHPKLEVLNLKLQALQAEQKLKANKLLPKLKIEYNFITETPNTNSNIVLNELKGGVNFSYPIFTRKERGDLRLSKLKIQDSRLDIDLSKVSISNKVKAIYKELDSYTLQNQLIYEVVEDTETLFRGEVRKFDLGESSIFLVNSREKGLIDARLKSNKLQNNFFKAKATLFKSIGIRPTL